MKMLYASLRYNRDQRSSRETKHNSILSRFLHIARLFPGSVNSLQAVGWILLNTKFSHPYFGVKIEL